MSRRLCHVRLALVLLPLIFFAACSSPMNEPRSRQLESYLAANDLRATDLAKQLGPSAVTVAEPFVSDAHPNSCHLAVQCVLESGGPDLAAIGAEPARRLTPAIGIDGRRKERERLTMTAARKEPQERSGSK